MLTKNIQVKRSLVNSALSTIVDFEQLATTDTAELNKIILLVVLVKFNKLDILEIKIQATTKGYKRYVLIFTSKYEYLRSNISYSYTQFPLIVAYTVTIYKLQGITID